MREPRFVYSIHSSEIPTLLEEYRTEMRREAAALESGRRIVAGDYSLENLQPIVAWKASRALGHVGRNTAEELEEALSLVVKGVSDRASIAILTGLNGVRTPMASAILTAIDPERFTVIDKLALNSLKHPRWDLTPGFYVTYLKFCRTTAQEQGLSLRDLDRALWQYSNRGEPGWRRKQVRQKLGAQHG
jgi:hypothetical protein